MIILEINALTQEIIYKFKKLMGYPVQSERFYQMRIRDTFRQQQNFINIVLCIRKIIPNSAIDLY